MDGKNHTFEILEECPLEYLNELETWWKLFYNSVEDGLNCNYWDSNKAHCKKEETKKRISLSNKGISRNKGIPKPKDFGEKISKSMKGWKPSKERGIKIGNKNKGRKNPKAGRKSLLVERLDLANNLLEILTIVEAKKKYKNCDISGCLLKKQKTAGGYKWSYLKNNIYIKIS